MSADRAGLKAKWIAALRSGEYKQANSYLGVQFDDGTKAYCCLGVLCEISGEGEWGDPKPIMHGGSEVLNAKSLQYVIGCQQWHSRGYIPGPLREGMAISAEAQQHLIGMNDAEKASFLDIADWIEKSL